MKPAYRIPPRVADMTQGPAQGEDSAGTRIRQRHDQRRLHERVKTASGGQRDNADTYTQLNIADGYSTRSMEVLCAQFQDEGRAASMSFRGNRCPSEKRGL